MAETEAEDEKICGAHRTTVLVPVAEDPTASTTSERAATTSTSPVSKLASAVREGTDRAVRVAREPFKRIKSSSADVGSASATVQVASDELSRANEKKDGKDARSEEGAQRQTDAKQTITTGSTSYVDDASTMLDLPVIASDIRASQLTVISCAVVSLYFSYRHWYVLLSDGMIPPSAGVSWVVFAFFLGRETKGRFQPYGSTGTTKQGDSSTVSFSGNVQSYAAPLSVSEAEKEQRNRFEALVNMVGKLSFRNTKLSNMKTNISTEELRSSLQKLPSKKLLFWKDNVDKSGELMKSLLQNPKLKRRHVTTSEKEHSAPDQTVGADGKLDEEKEQDNQLGTLDITEATTTKKKDDVIIEPMFSLRGIDVFLTDGNPEERIWELPALKACGLRTVPTFCLNCCLPWCNFVVYFQMPEWFEDTNESLEVKDDDPADIKSLKKFLKGSSEYRSQRFALFPCLVEGPLPIRVMASPGEDYEVGAEYLPMTWHLVEGRGGEAPLLGLDIDATSDKVLRSAASLAKRYLKSISIDVGAVIEDDDAACCLGLWRMNRIDVTSCPALPERTVEEDTKRASLFKLTSQSQMVKVVA